MLIQPHKSLAVSEIAAIALRPADADGTWRLVPGGAVADVVVGADGDELVAVHSPAPMAAPRNHGSAPLADRAARDGQRVVLGEASDLTRYLDLWRVLTAAALVGIAERAMRMGVDYVLERHQFGRPIGSFQSIQHGLADLPALVDGGRFLAHKAAWAFDEGLVDGAGVIDMDEGNITEFAPLAAMAHGLRGRCRRGQHGSQPPLPRGLRILAGIRHSTVFPTS